jgi:hypothetical protein
MPTHSGARQRSLWLLLIKLHIIQPHKNRPMKNLLLALTMLATVSTAFATDTKPGKPAKKATKEAKMQCSKEEKPGASCCAKKATTAAVVAPVAPESAKK